MRDSIKTLFWPDTVQPDLRGWLAAGGQGRPGAGQRGGGAAAVQPHRHRQDRRHHGTGELTVLHK